MKCIITEIEKRERENAVPYFVIRATGQTGDATASVLDANGFVNPLACMSRTYQFTKTLFPATDEQAQAIETQVVEGIPIMLDFVRMPSPYPFYIIKDKDTDVVEDRYYCEDVQEEITNTSGKTMTLPNGQKVAPNGIYSVITKKPRVFKEVTLTVFTTLVDGKEVCAEGDGTTLLQRAWERGVTNGIYEKAE